MIYDSDAPPEEIWRTGRVEFALRYPFSNGWRTVAGCGVLAALGFLVLSAVPAVAVFFSYFSFFLPPTVVAVVTVAVVVSFAVPALAVVGYGYAVCRETAYGGLRVPSFGSIGFRALRGVGVVFVAGVVLVPVAVATADTAFFYEENAGGEAVAVIVTLGAVVGYYLLTAFVTVYAVTGSILRTFLSARALRFAVSAFYVRAWILQFVFGVALLIVGFMSLPTVVGFFFWLGYAPVALASYWGRVYKEAMDAGVVKPEDTAV
ncbi:MAG: DUF4013 domain-containing protein [Halobacteriales archaeon]|nr:DUF4013 domain-containing protein [Halobacteriales archaeon]